MGKIVYSALQPSGQLTIGNYLGSIKNFKSLQDQYECFFNVADLHSITVPQEPKLLRERTLDLMAIFLASGITCSTTCRIILGIKLYELYGTT